MRILHLTDFHYQSSKKVQFDQTKLIESLVTRIKTEAQINFLIFSGDLVQSGSNKADFERAKKELIDRICFEINIPHENIFLCAGNHDVSQGIELTPITESISKIKSNQELEKFVTDQDGKSFKLSLEGLRNYKEFEKSFYQLNNLPDADKVSSLYSTHYRTFEDKRIGIVCLDSAWRALDSKTDRGNLMYPISVLKTAIHEIKQKADFKIALLHHPISDFKDWNAAEIENLIHSEFHLLFSGHVHLRRQSLHICADEGILCCFSPATLALDNYSNIGYSIIEVDTDSFDVKIESRKYDKIENTFYDIPQIFEDSIPVNNEKKEQNNFRQTLRRRYSEGLKRANELFVSKHDKEGKGFIDLFTEPVLKAKTKAQIVEQKSDSAKISLETITFTSDNFVIYGKDKSGKTSNLFKIHLDLLKGFTMSRTISIYLDCKEYKLSSSEFNIINVIQSYYELNQAKSEELIGKYKIRLLLDNYDPNFSDFNDILNELLHRYENISFVATAEETLITSFDTYHFDGRTYKNIFIQEISKSEVRLLANKWPNLTPTKRELILDKIFKVLKQLNIQANFWTVSLFIWVFEKNQEANVRNNFELIQYYIDDLLDKDRLIHDRSLKIEFEDFKEFLSKMSHFLVTEHSKEGYTATYTEIINFTQKYINDNKRFVIGVEEILRILLSKGILRKNGVERYTIRLTGVFEFFIAYYMKDHPEFRDKVISDDHYYLSFSNELELCAGFNRKDQEYVKKIFEKTKVIFSELTQHYDSINIDRNLELKVSGSLEQPIDKLQSEINGALTTEQQDEYFSDMQVAYDKQSEVSPKKFYEKIELNHTNYEKSLFILSRVFRNSALPDDKFNDDVLNFILQSTCLMGFNLLDEVKAELQEDKDETKEKLMMRLISTFMPLIVQNFLYDALAQNNLERIILDKIETLKVDIKSDNQFKLMLLYFLLVDLNLKAYKGYLPEIMSSIKVGILKQTVLIKLYGYLMFECSQNSQLEGYIKSLIQTQSININSKADKSTVQQRVNKIIQQNRIKKN
ncbi:metallophosphoesterase [Mucilaginibacter sp. 3215]|uniref:metallophosphoesterase n=1 Tax=Mucilaginibacter sp. 3215 TaxID=3373912 RepID=UPI003D22FE54